MKYNKIQILFILAFSALTWTACDKIDEPVKIINVQDIPDNLADTLFFTDSVWVAQKQVLLEEFTGHKCVNCAEQSIAEGQCRSLRHGRLAVAHGATPDDLPDLRSIIEK